MPEISFEPGTGDVARGTIWLRTGAPTNNVTFLNQAGLGDLYVNTTVGSVALYLCTAATATTITWTQITVP